MGMASGCYQAAEAASRPSCLSAVPRRGPVPTSPSSTCCSGACSSGSCSQAQHTVLMHSGCSGVDQHTHATGVEVAIGSRTMSWGPATHWVSASAAQLALATAAARQQRISLYRSGSQDAVVQGQHRCRCIGNWPAHVADRQSLHVAGQVELWSGIAPASNGMCACCHSASPARLRMGLHLTAAWL